jgi:hypothetical protein
MAESSPQRAQPNTEKRTVESTGGLPLRFLVLGEGRRRGAPDGALSTMGNVVEWQRQGGDATVNGDGISPSCFACRGRRRGERNVCEGKREGRGPESEGKGRLTWGTCRCSMGTLVVVEKEVPCLTRPS